MIRPHVKGAIDGKREIENLTSQGHPLCIHPFPWLNSAAGMSGKVPAPWPDLDVKDTSRGISVSPWNRRYDFDGMMRVDWILSAKSPVRLDELTLEILLKAEYAEYLYHFPAQWDKAPSAGLLPRRGVGMPFRPFMVGRHPTRNSLVQRVG